jgi:hypothetical protein
MGMSDPNYSLDQYITQLKNTVHAAYEDGYDRTELHNRFEGLLFELREDHQPRIDTPEELRAELDLFLRDAYLPTDQVIEVLEAKIEELEGIGGEPQIDPDAGVSSDVDEVLPADGDEELPPVVDESLSTDTDETLPSDDDKSE